MEASHVVVVCGGAVSGSEAASRALARGAKVIVLEQNRRPYGKIEDGLPRWHKKLREREYGRINASLDQPGIYFVPNTTLGQDISFDMLVKELAPSVVLLANGAWKDRALGDDFAPYVEKGLLYQNPFVYWFNHYEDDGYDGPQYTAKEGALVVGGGLASIDVVKILSMELYGNALRERGIEVDMHAMEVGGIPKLLEKHGLTVEALGIKGPTLFYRRRAEDMPLASAPNPTPEQLARLQSSRLKILQRVCDRFLVNFEGQSVVAGPIIDGERLGGLRIQKTRLEGRRVIPLPETETEWRSDLVISSIGSIPLGIEGIPMRGELYAFKNWDTGSLSEELPVFGLGNVLTGKGNIRASRKNAQEVGNRVLDYLIGRDEGEDDGHALSDAAHAQAAADADLALDRLRDVDPLPGDHVQRILDWAARRQAQVGYGEYGDWVARA